MAPRPIPSPAPSTRAAAKRETRRALVRAARDAFAEEGLDGPSLDAICERAGKTRGAFYVHFESREDLVAAVMEDTLSRVVDGVIGSDESDATLEETVARYVELARAVGEIAGRGVRFHQLLDACSRRPDLAARLRRVLDAARGRLESAAKRAVASGRASADLPPPETANLLLLLALGLLVTDELGLSIDLDPTRDALLALLAPRR